MESKEESAIKGGVITSYDLTNQKYECSACGRQGCGDLGAHLSSREHNNSLVWEAVRNPTPSQYLLEVLPEEVKQAKKCNEIEVVDKDVFTYKCLVCEGKRPFSGLPSLVAHLTGKEHLKAKKQKHFQSLLKDQGAASPGLGAVPVSTSQLPFLPQPGYGGYNIPSQQHPTSAHHPQPPVRYGINVPTSQPGLVGYHPSQTPPLPPSHSHVPPYHWPGQVMSPPGSVAYQMPGQVPFSPGSAYVQAPQPLHQGLYHQPQPQRTDVYGTPQPPLANIFTGQPQQSYDDPYLTSKASALPTTTAQAAYSTPTQSSPGQGRSPQGPATTQVQPNQPSDTMSARSSPQPQPSDNHLAVVSSTTGSAGEGGAEAGSRFVADLLVSERLSAECVEALTAKIVTRTNNGFYCNVCIKSMTGAMPLMQHINSDKHKKRVQLWKIKNAIPLDPSDLRGLSLTDSRTVMADPAANHPEDAAMHPPPYSTIHQLDDCRAVFWSVKGCSSPQNPSENVYRNLSDPRGLVVIFNYSFKGTRNERLGAIRDSFTLKKLFTDMGYEVHLHESLSKQETIKTLEHIQSDPILEKVDSFIVFVLSHGTGNLIFATNDNQQMSLDEIRYSFVDEACPSLKSKPKIFFANFCRGQFFEINKKLQHDYIPTSDKRKEAPQDMVTWHASINEFKALRDQRDGTVFAQALCEVFAEQAHNTELADLYLRVTNRMKEKEGTTPEEQRYNFKRFYFNPK